MPEWEASDSESGGYGVLWSAKNKWNVETGWRLASATRLSLESRRDAGQSATDNLGFRPAWILHHWNSIHRC